MPRYPQAPERLSSREKKFAMMQQMQQGDIAQQQVDAQQQAAMMNHIQALYGMQNQQDLHPLQVQQAQLANDRASMELQNLPDIYDLQRQIGHSNLQTAEQGRMLAGAADQRQGAMHPINMRAAEAGAGLNELQLQHMPDQYALADALQQSTLDTSQLGRQLAQAQEGRAVQLHQPTLDMANLGVQQQQFNVEHQPDIYGIDMAGKQSVLDTQALGRFLANVANSREAEMHPGQLAHQNALTTGTRANTAMILNPMAQMSAEDQMNLYNGMPMGTVVGTGIKRQAAKNAQAMASQGFNPDGTPMVQPAQQSTQTVYEPDTIGAWINSAGQRDTSAFKAGQQFANPFAPISNALKTKVPKLKAPKNSPLETITNGRKRNTN